VARWYQTPGEEPRLVNLDALTDIEVLAWPEGGDRFAVVGYLPARWPAHNNLVVLDAGYPTRKAAHDRLADHAKELTA